MAQETSIPSELLAKYPVSCLRFVHEVIQVFLSTSLKTTKEVVENLHICIYSLHFYMSPVVVNRLNMTYKLFGQILYDMIEYKLLRQSPEDSLSDFDVEASLEEKCKHYVSNYYLLELEQSLNERNTSNS